MRLLCLSVLAGCCLSLGCKDDVGSTQSGVEQDAGENGESSATEGTEPPVDDDTAPPADDDTAPPADDDTELPVDDDTAPPADDDTTPPADDDTAPPADDDTTQGVGGSGGTGGNGVGGSAGQAGMGGAGGAGGTPEPVFTCDAVSFESEPRPLTLPEPPVGYPWSVLERPACAGSGNAFSLMDMNGDARPDILVYGDCSEALVGITRWDIYLNNGTGFPDMPQDWPLPQSPQGFPWSALERNSCNAAGAQGFAYVLRDMNADQRPDVLVYWDCENQTVGTTHWDVYLNLGDGFASTATPWALPEPQIGYEWTTPERQSCDTVGAQGAAYTLRDMDGDGSLDILVYLDCTDATVGLTHWKVHLNNGTGFDSEPLEWALPEPPPNYPFTQLERASCDSVGALGFAYTLRDINGDLRPDIVVHWDCTDVTVGATHWDVYQNSGTGFATTAREWALPEPPPNYPWTTLERTSCDTIGAQGFAFALRDMNADQRPDILVYTDCSDSAVGVAYWNVYLNSPTGFAATPQQIALPEPQPNYPWSALDRTSCDTAGAQGTAYTLRDMSGDGVPDLFIYNDCSSSLVGLARWDLYPGVCAP